MNFHKKSKKKKREKLNSSLISSWFKWFNYALSYSTKPNQKWFLENGRLKRGASFSSKWKYKVLSKYLGLFTTNINYIDENKS